MLKLPNFRLLWASLLLTVLAMHAAPSATAGEILSGSAGIPADSFKDAVYQQPEPVEPMAAVDLTYEVGQRELQRFHDSAYSRYAARFFFDKALTLDTHGVVAGITFDRGNPHSGWFAGRFRIEGSYVRGDAHGRSSIFIERQTTDTISIDGVQPQPSIFSISTYDINVRAKERSGEGVLLGEITSMPTRHGTLSVSAGPKVGYRQQDWSIDYLGTYELDPTLQAVHYVREELSTPYAGLAARLAWQEQITGALKANISLDGSLYGQVSRLTGTDCFSIRFAAPICDGRHHGRGAFEYRSDLDERSTRVGGHLKFATKVAWSFPLGSTQGTLRAGGYVEGRFNDPAIDNPDFYNPRPAQVKYGNVIGYGISLGGSIKF